MKFQTVKLRVDYYSIVCHSGGGKAETTRRPMLSSPVPVLLYETHSRMDHVERAEAEAGSD